jgi:hypothetical protein
MDPGFILGVPCQVKRELISFSIFSGKNLKLPPPISYNPVQPAARICKKYIEVSIHHLFKLILGTPIRITRRIKEYV